MPELPLSMLFPTDKRLRVFQRSLPDLSASDRKALVTLCRAQHVPSRSESKILSYQTFGSTFGTDALKSPLSKLARLVKDYIESPLFSGLVLDLARCCEPTEAEIKEMSEASWLKEILACSTERRPNAINFAAVFDQSRFQEGLIPGVTPRPEVNAYIHQLLVEWRSRVTSKTLFPRMSTKAASHNSRREADQVFPLWRLDQTIVDENQMFTQVVMEKLYAETGLKTRGMCEVRQKLYRAGITPRTYFAQGGDAYFSSRFLQDPCSQLVDILPVANHVLRLIPTNLQLDNIWQHVFIYDLKSFTSLFHEFLPFLRMMAEFCRGYEVAVWEGTTGLVVEDFGELWDSYCDFNASCPPYSVEKWTKNEEDVFYHLCAGFLGVYGNLMICTFVHAIVVLAVVGDMSKCYTAGDDGGAVLMCLLVLVWDGRKNPPKRGNSVYDDVFTLFYALSLLGIIQWSKVFTTQESGAIALKRPLRQVEGRLDSPGMIVWPQSILIEMYVNWNSHRDARFHTYYMFNSRKDCRGAILSEVTRFLTHVAASEFSISDENLDVVRKYCVWIYGTINAPVEGFVPQFSSLTYYDDFVPTLEKPLESFRREPIRDTIRRLWHGEAIVPDRVGESNYQEGQIDLSIGAEFVSSGSRELGWLKKLGYVEAEKLTRRVEGEAGFHLLVREYVRPVTTRLPASLYRYRVNKLPPMYGV